MSNVVLYTMFAIVVIMFLFLLFIVIFWRWIVKRIVQKTSHILLTDSYQENILELMPGLLHVGVKNVFENSLRSTTGNLIHRPLGSFKKWPNFESLTFIPAQTSPFAVSSDEEVDISVTLGPKAKKPLELDLPLLISGMGYGLALSEDARLALATAAKNVGTAINSGEGAVIQEELEAAGKYILQFSKSKWAKDEKLLKSVDMIEIKLGQGALMSMGVTILPENLTGRAREEFGLDADENAVIHEHFFENQTLNDLKDLVSELRQLTGGVPIGAKIGAGGRIEEDIDHLLEMGVDVIAIDGGQAATLGAPPILSDDFGIPTLHALVRAVHHLEQVKKREDVSLIISGGLVNPGHFLKALALGADAVYLGSAMLFAVTHGQSIKALPFEPPTQVVWNEGKFRNQFSLEQGVKSAENFLLSCAEEMKTALRAMGKNSLKQLSKDDLVSYDPLIAEAVGVPYSFQPMKKKKKQKGEI